MFGQVRDRDGDGWIMEESGVEHEAQRDKTGQDRTEGEDRTRKTGVGGGRWEVEGGRWKVEKGASRKE